MPGPRGPGARRNEIPSYPSRLLQPQAFRYRPVPQCGSRKRPLCLPKKPAPEGRHSACRGREAPGLEGENFPPLQTCGGRHHRHFDVGHQGPKTTLESMSGSGVFAVRSLWQIRIIWFTGQPPHNDSREPTATHTLHESPKPIARLQNRFQELQL